MTRIIAGRLRGRRIQTPKGSATRPTSDRTREALFSALAARGVLEDARVLDLFAGSGALGLEAISRGARSAVLVDQDRLALAAMRRTLAELGDELGSTAQQVRVYARDVYAYVRAPGTPHDLVFLDPPYDLDAQALTTALVALTAGWLAPEAVVVVERSVRSGEPAWPKSLALDWGRTYGETAIWVARFDLCDEPHRDEPH